MTKKHLLLSLLVLFSGHLMAQYETILNDPDVVWAAEIDLRFWIEPEFTAPDSVYNDTNYSTLLKLFNRTANPEDESELLLSRRVLDLLYEERIPAFAHPDSLRPLTMKERSELLNIKDTVTVIDPVSGMESNRQVYNCWTPESMQQIRVRQLLFYRDKTDEFELYTLAFAPILVRNYGAELSDDHYQYLPFWLKMPPYRKKASKGVHLDDPNITWARRMRTGTNMPALDSLRPYKDFKRPIMQQYLNRLREDPKFKVRDGFDWAILSSEAREQYFTKTDTVVTFDPETYEEKLVIVHHSIAGQEVMQLRLVEDWFWDERHRYPIFQLYAFAPMEDVKDDEGNFRFKRPLFWRMIRD